MCYAASRRGEQRNLDHVACAGDGFSQPWRVAGEAGPRQPSAGMDDEANLQHT